MRVENKYKAKNTDDLLFHVVKKLLPYWPVLVVMMILSLIGAWVYTQSKSPLYESTATILIKDERKGTEDSKVAESLDLLSSKKIIENEIEVLKSREIIGLAVKSLKLYAPVYTKQRWKWDQLYENSPVSIEVRNPDSLVEKSAVNFKVNDLNGFVSIQGKTYPMNHWVVTPYGNLKFTVKKARDYSNVPLYFSLINPKRVVSQIENSLTVSSVNKLASVITLKLRDPDPKLCEDMLNSIITIYDQTTLNDKFTLARNTLTFLDDRLKLISSDLTTIERQLQEYRTSKSSIDIPAQGKLFLQNVSETDQQLNDVNLKLSVLDQVEQSLFSNDHQNAMVPTSLGYDEPVLSNLLSKLYDLELQNARLKNTTGENNPTVVSIASEIEKIKPSIAENVRSLRKSLELKKNALSSTNVTYNSMLESLPKQERDIIEISREKNTKTSIYSFLLQKREETALSLSSMSADSRIMDKAESTMEPVSPSNKMIYLIALLGALALYTGIIFLWEYLNPNIQSIRDLESATSMPVIGEIAMDASKKPIVIEEDKSNTGEHFRVLRTSISNTLAGLASKKIMITSTLSGEGKSFVTTNLGITLSLAGKKVVLIDFDFNNPSLSQVISMNADTGLSSYLSGGSDIHSIIKRSKENENLYFISAGAKAKNPSDLISNVKTALLFEHLEKNFDYILIDTPPVGIVSDGFVLSKYADLTLYIVKQNFTPKRKLKQIMGAYNLTELTNPMIVFNGVVPRGFLKKKQKFIYGQSQ